MIKRLSLFCFLAGLAGAQTPTVTSVTYDSLSHSTIRIDFQTSATFTQGHIRYIDTTVNPGGVCTDGASGVVQPTQYTSLAGPTYGSYQMMVGGLTPGDTYSFCPEISNTNNGVYSTGGPSLSVTMPGLPSTHPMPPITPATFPTGYPSDMANYATLTLGTNCTGFVACMTTAINNQLSNGTIIYVPANVSASSIGGIGPFGGEGVFPVSPDVVNFSSSAVSTSAGTITSPGHGFTEGSQAVFGVSYGCLPGDYTSNPSNCKEGGNNNPIPFPRGVPLYVHVVNANTFRLYTCPGANNGTAPSCAFSSGTPLTFADAGSGTMRYAKWPRALHYIIIRTSTPDSQFVPLGSMLQGPPDGTGVPTRPTQWVSKMGNLQVSPGAAALITFGDLNTDPMTANIRVVGIHFSYTDTSEPSVSGDPTNGGAFFATDLATQNITWDRCYFDSPGTPFRTGIVFSWNGVNNGFFGNYVTGMEAWNQTASGLAVSGSGTTATITSGSTHFGAGAGILSSNATIRLSGSMSSQQRMFLDFSMGGTLNIVPPPGIAATVSGVSNYHVVTLAAGGPAVLSLNNSSLTVPTGAGINTYYVDPISAPTSAACASGTPLFPSIGSTPSYSGSTGSYSVADVGLQFTATANGYICGVRFYKDPSNTSTHTGGLWNASGTLLASGTFTGETASGYQRLLFASPVAVTSGSTYTVGYHSTTGYSYSPGTFQNMDYDNANMHVTGAYVSSNGNGSYGDTWPQDYRGNVAVGILGYVDITASGTIADAGNSGIGTTYSGGNTMIGGLGPGPWMMIANFVSAAGLPWHFDNSGARWAMRGDYTLLRNYRYGPRYTFYGTPYSNGLDYTWRQPLEWKGGNRLQVYGEVFDGSMFEGGSKSMIALQSPGEVNCVTDADVMYNTFKHGPGPLSGGLEYGTAPMSCPPVRTRYANNVSWDMNGIYGVNNSGTGWLLSGQIGAEDVIIDHNTDVGRSGGRPSFWDQAEFHIEGVQITNNFLQVEPQFGGVGQDSTYFQTTGPSSCVGLTGKAMADCKWTPSYTMTHNVLLPVNGTTPSQIQSFWPAPLVNYIPANGSVGAQGFFSAQNSYSLTTPDPNLELRSTSAYCAGCVSPGTLLTTVGADMKKLRAMQGVITGTDSGPTGSTTGFVTVDQPDTYTCTLEYGSDPTFTAGTNLRVTKSCTPGAVTFNLTGLTSKSVVYWKFYGAVQEPQGQFHVN